MTGPHEEIADATTAQSESASAPQKRGSWAARFKRLITFLFGILIGIWISPYFSSNGWVSGFQTFLPLRFLDLNLNREELRNIAKVAKGMSADEISEKYGIHRVEVWPPLSKEHGHFYMGAQSSQIGFFWRVPIAKAGISNYATFCFDKEGKLIDFGISEFTLGFPTKHPSAK